MLMFGLRLGADPRVVVTTTPRTTSLIRGLIADPTVIVTRGSTYENRANLASAFLGQIIRKYQGTRLGRQELDAELLEDVPGALWNRGMLEGSRVRAAPPLIRVVVAIDPAASSSSPTPRVAISRPNGPKQLFQFIARTGPIGSWRRSTMAATWSRQRCE